MIINKTADGLIKYPPHAHSDYEIALYLKGEGYMRADKEKIPFKKGTVIVIPPKTVHGSVSKNGFCNITVGLNHTGLFSFTSVLCCEDGTGELTSLIELMYRGRDKSEAYLTALIEAFIIRLKESASPKSDIEKAVEKVVEKINEDFLKYDINLKEFLISTGYAEDYARDNFKRLTGFTPKEYLARRRIERAKFLIDLYSRTKPIYEIAEECGYGDYVYFSKKFKEYTGFSPREYIRARFL